MDDEDEDSFWPPLRRDRRVFEEYLQTAHNSAAEALCRAVRQAGAPERDVSAVATYLGRAERPEDVQKWVNQRKSIPVWARRLFTVHWPPGYQGEEVDERLRELQAILGVALVQFGLIARAKRMLARNQPADLELLEIARLHSDLQELDVQRSRLFSGGGKRGRRDKLQVVIDGYVVEHPTARRIDVYHHLRRLAHSTHPVIEEVTEDRIIWAGHPEGTSIKSLSNRLTRARRLIGLKKTRHRPA